MAAAAGRAGSRAAPVAVAAMIGAVAIWSWTNTIVRVSQLHVLTFTLYRLWMGAAGLLLVLALTRRRLTWLQLRAAAPAGALLGVEVMFFFGALKFTSIVDVTVISSLQPALTLVVAGPLFGEIVGRREVAWTAVSVLGVALVAIGSSGTPAWSLGGDLLAAASLLAWTAYFVLSKRVRDTVATLEFMTAVTLVAAVLATPFALLSGEPLGGIHALDVLLLTLFVLGGTGGHLLVAWAHPRIDVSVSSLLMLGQPLVSGVAGLVVLGQRIAPLEYVGGLVVVGAVAAILRQATRSSLGGRVAAAEAPPP